MHNPMTFEAFYRSALAANGVHIEPEPIEKMAEARGVDVAVAKLAKAAFDQSRLDGVNYGNEKDRLADAFKIAEAYVAHVDEAHNAATKLAADLHRVAAHAVESYLAQHGINLSADDGVKIAAVAAEEMEQKIAAPGSDFAARMAAARAAKKAKGGAPKADEAAPPKADEKPADAK